METYFSGNVRVQELTDLIVEKLFTVCLLSGKDAADEFVKGRAAVEKLGQILLDLRSLSQAALVDGLIQLVEQRFPDRRVTNNFPSMRSTLEDMVREGVANLSAFFPAMPATDSSVKQELAGEGGTKVVLPGGKTPATRATPVTSAEPQMPVRSAHWSLSQQPGSAVVRVEKSMITGNMIGGSAGQPPKKDEAAGEPLKKDKALPASEANPTKETEDKGSSAGQFSAPTFVLDLHPAMTTPAAARVWPPLLQGVRTAASDDGKTAATKIEPPVILESVSSEVREGIAKAESKPAEVRESIAKAEPKSAEVRESIAKVEPKPAEVRESIAKAEPKPAEVRESIAKVEPKPAEVRESIAKAEPKPAEVRESIAKAEPKPAEVRESIAKAEPKPAEVRESIAKAEPKPAEVRESIAKAEPKSAEVRESIAKAEPKSAEVRESIAKVEPKPPKVKESVVKVVAKALEFKESVAKSKLKPPEAKVSAVKAEAGSPESAGREGKAKASFGREPVPADVGREPLSTEKETVKSAAPGPNRGLPRQSPLPPEAIRLGAVLKYLFSGQGIRWDISLANCPFLAQVADLLVYVADGQELHPSIPLLKKEGWRIVVFSREDISFPRRMERMIRMATRRASSQ